MNESVAAETWLAAWEAASALPPGLREAALLQPACAPSRREDLARLPLGRRDALLLDLRAALFGPVMACTADCPACGETCEWSAPVAALRQAEEADAPDVHEWSADGWRVRFRLPDGSDLAVLHGRVRDDGAAARRLLERCVLEAARDGAALAARELPDALLEPLSVAMALADPQAATSVALGCPACGHAWEADLDVAAFLWTELDAWARRTLDDVHQLASRYGWTEPEVLALSPTRRAFYLALGGA